jgi:hypothetical protein
MAEFNFYGAPEDFWAQLDRLITTDRFRFFLDLSSKEKKPYEFTILTEEIKQSLKINHTIFLWSKEYSEFPLFFNQSSNGLFRIFPLIGGPLLELHLPHANPHETGIRLIAGNLMHQASYSIADTGCRFAASENLKLAYKDVIKLFKQNMVKRYTQVQIARNGIFRDEVATLWIGNNAMELLETGKAAIQAGQWKEGKDLYKDRTKV